MANVRLDWDIIQLGDDEGVFTTLQDLYAVGTQEQVLGRMRHIVDGIVHPKRTVQFPDRNIERAREIQAILKRIEKLCASEGTHFAEPLPTQHILRAKDGDKTVVVRDTTRYEETETFSGYSPGFPACEKTEDLIRINFYWALTDLVGLFLTKLGPAPSWAQEKNFYLPLTAVYARWVTRLIHKAKFFSPSKYQCTWIRPDPSTPGGFDEFSLGASLGGLRCGANLQSDLQRARWELIDKDPEIHKAEFTKVWKDENQIEQSTTYTWGFDKIPPVGLWKFGNCAETHPLIVQHLIATAKERKDRTHGFAIDIKAVKLDAKNEWLNYNEGRMLHIRETGDGRQYMHIVAPCENCKFLINHYGANMTHFTPISVFPLPRVGATRS